MNTTPLTFYPVLDNSYENPTREEKLTQLQEKITNELGDTLRIASTPESADLILVGGGDGYMFKMMRTYHKYDKPFFGINCGTTGFLLNQLSTEKPFPETENQLEYVKAPIIPVTVLTTENKEIDGFFTNDITIGGHSVDGYEFTLAFEDDLINTFATGININTPVGSTGYALNLRQPVLPLKSNLLGVAGIAGLPFRHTFRKPQKITVTASRIREHPVAVGMDGRAHFIEGVTKVTLYPAVRHTRIAFNKDEPFEERRILQTQEKIGKIDTRNR